MTEKQYAQRNLRLFQFIKMLTKRVYLPLLAVYLVEVVGFSASEIGVLAGYVAFITLLTEIPSGYFSDKISRRYSFMLMGLLGAIGMAIFVSFESRLAIYVALTLETLAYSFHSGSGQALIHDSLSVLGKKETYSKYMGKVQSNSLIVNAVLIGLVVSTYSINEKLPFVLGIVQFLILLSLAYFTRDVGHDEDDHTDELNLGWISRHKQFLFFAAIFGVFAALYTAPSDFRNLAHVEYGLQPEFLGWVFAAASITGAIFGYFLNWVKSLGLKKYIILDITVATLSLVLFSIGSVAMSVLGFIIVMAFWRYRHIVYEDFMFQKYTTKFKATLLSITFEASEANAIWMAVVLGFIVSAVGIQQAFLIAAVFTLFYSLVFYKVTTKTLQT